MRIAIISDIHSNLVALQAVLDGIGACDQLWNLGDTIGYGPRPNECMQLMHEHATVMITGNHDLACIGEISLADFNIDARRANEWNGQRLSPIHHEKLKSLLRLQEISPRFMVAHGSPRDPVWEYLLTPEQARNNFKLFVQDVCFVGHSHVPLIFAQHLDGRCTGPDLPTAQLSPEGNDSSTFQLEAGVRYLINPGSVGQPRDQDRRAAYAILDDVANTVTFHRVEYNIDETQKQMHDAQLPAALIRRLQFGM